MHEYIVYFMRGDKFTVQALSEADALKKCWKDQPQTRSWDVLKVQRKENA